MDFKFDANAAEYLIKRMNKCCSTISKESKNLQRIISDNVKWNDNQKRAFCNNITALGIDLDETVSLEQEYIEYYEQKVNELRG
jgi:hypothetical protein